MFGLKITLDAENRIKNIMSMYNDNRQDAIKNMKNSDKNRFSYYKAISDCEWSKAENYYLCINSSIGKEETAHIIIDHINNLKNKYIIKQ